MPTEGLDLPPLFGIARARRKDKGVPRKNPLDELYDTFADMPPDAQSGVLQILGVIHRQSLRDKAKEAECLKP